MKYTYRTYVYSTAHVGLRILMHPTRKMYRNVHASDMQMSQRRKEYLNCIFCSSSKVLFQGCLNDRTVLLCLLCYVGV